MSEQQPATFKCKACGSSLEYAAGMQALKCPFCGNVTEIDRPDEQVDDVANAEIVVPMTVERSDLEKVAYQHMASGEYTPDDLMDYATFTKVERFYVPAYLYNGRYEAQWTASFGYDRKESYTSWEKDAQGNSKPVTRTKTVTDWRPASGQASGSFAVFGYAGNRLSAKVQPLVENSSGASNATKYDASFISGMEIEAFAIPDGKVYADRVKPKINAIIDRSVESHKQGDHQKDWMWNGQIDKHSHASLLPVCHISFDYRGKTYEIWADGADATQIVADDLPKDTQRKRAVRLGFIPLAAALTSAAIAFFAFPQVHSAWLPASGGAAIAALIYGQWRRQSLLGYSARLRKSLLSQRQAATQASGAMANTEQQKLAEQMQRPKRPWIVASVARDAWAVPVLSLLAFVAPLAATFTQQSPLGAASTTIASSQDRSSHAPALQSPNAPVVDRSMAARGARVEPVRSLENEAQSLSQAPSDEQSAPGTGVTAAVNLGNLFDPERIKPSQREILKMAHAVLAGDDAALEAARGNLAALPRNPLGDRVAARAAQTAGVEALKNGDSKGAVLAFASAWTLDKSDIEVMNNFGWALLKAGRPQEAYFLFVDTLRHAPARSTAWINLSAAVLELGKGTSADASSTQQFSEAGFLLAYRFAIDRPRLQALYERQLATATDSGEAAVLRTVVARIQGTESVGKTVVEPQARVAAADAKGSSDPSVNALQLTRQSAEQGDAQAQLELGLAYYKGQGVPQDYAQATEWFGRAAAQDNVGGMVALGLMYREGQGGPVDLAAAAEQFSRAAALGNSTAERELGVMYDRGWGVPQDYNKAAAWYGRAAKQGDAMAQANLNAVSSKIAQQTPRSYASLAPVPEPQAHTRAYPTQRAAVTTPSQQQRLYAPAAPPQRLQSAPTVTPYPRGNVGTPPQQPRAFAQSTQPQQRPYALATPQQKSQNGHIAVQTPQALSQTAAKLASQQMQPRAPLITQVPKVYGH